MYVVGNVVKVSKAMGCRAGDAGFGGHCQAFVFAITISHPMGFFKAQMPDTFPHPASSVLNLQFCRLSLFL